MATTEQSFSLSVRGEAQRTTAPDEAGVFVTLRAAAGSKREAMSRVEGDLSSIQGELAALGGEVLTASRRRVPLTWSTQSIQTHESTTTTRPPVRTGPLAGISRR